MNLRVVIQYGEKLDSIQLGPLGEVASVGEKERLSVGEEEGFLKKNLTHCRTRNERRILLAGDIWGDSQRNFKCTFLYFGFRN